MTSADMLRTSADLVRNRAGERREADPLAQLLVQLIARIGEPATVECSGSKMRLKNSAQKFGVAGQKFRPKIRAKNCDEKEPFNGLAQALQAPFLMPGSVDAR